MFRLLGNAKMKCILKMGFKQYLKSLLKITLAFYFDKAIPETSVTTLNELKYVLLKEHFLFWNKNMKPIGSIYMKKRNHTVSVSTAHNWQNGKLHS